MITYQDYLQVSKTEPDRAAFVRKVINDHKSSSLYQTAKIADDYDRGRNTTIMNYQKTVTTVTGQVVPDVYSAVHRSASNFFSAFVTQLNQYLLGNGVTWREEAPEALGKDFDNKLQKAGRYALAGGVSFGFFNLDHIDVFSVLEFAPLYDEEDGSIKAGVRFWQIDDQKPLRATFYELDGYTNYLWSSKFKPSENWKHIRENTYMLPKKPYITRLITSEVDGTEIYAEENYPTFPIVPLWGNPKHQSDIENLREKIDAYDFILNGFEDDLDNAQLYWIIRGAGGMDDPDLMKFLDRLRMTKAAAPDDGQEVVPVTVSIPYEARERLLDRIEKQLYKDAMIMNPEDIAGGATTATQIKAAYERQNNKADQFEYCVLDFINGICDIAGIENEASFTRSLIVNTQEEITTVIAAAQFLDTEYVTRKILTLLGDGDQADEILNRIETEEQERMGLVNEEDLTYDESMDDQYAEDEAALSDKYLDEFGSEVISALEELVGEL